MEGVLSPVWGMTFRWQHIPFHVGTEGAAIYFFFIRKDAVGRAFWRLRDQGYLLLLLTPFLKQEKGGEFNVIMKEKKWKRKGFPLDRVGARNLQR